MKKKLMKFLPILVIGLSITLQACEKEDFRFNDYNKEIDPPPGEKKGDG